MRVSFVDDEPQIYPLQYGGKARTILSLAKSALGSDLVDGVTVLSRSIDDPRDAFADYDGVNFERLDDQNMIGRIAEEAEEADVLSVHTCSFTFPRIPLSRRRAALVYHLHDVMLTTADKGSHLDKALAGDWDAIVAPSEFATNTYRNFAALTGNSAEIYTIPRGVDPELFYEVPRDQAIQELKKKGIVIDDKRKPILFFPGRASVGKGDDQIGEICHSLSEKYEDFLVVTTNDVDSPKPHANVMHIGWQESDRLRYLYSAADLTLSLSKLPESFSQVCIESIACGTPVLAFPFGNLSRLSQTLPAVRVCEPTTTAITENVHNMLADPAIYQALEQSQATLETTYSIGEISQTYLGLYMDIVRRRKEALHVPESYFISPFASIHGGIAYISDNDNSPLRAHHLTRAEEMILECCGTATSVDEIRLTTGLSSGIVRFNLDALIRKKVIIGGKNERSIR